MSDPLELWFPLPPNLGNARLHSLAKHRMRTKYFAECDRRRTVRYHLPAPPAVPLERAHVAITYHRRGPDRAMDPDNAHARAKWILDWCVTRGYLAGDSPAHLTLAPAAQQRATADTPALCRVQVVIIPLEAGAP